MSLRPKAMINRIVDTLVDGIDEIRTARDKFSGPIPSYIGRVYDIEAASCPLPAVLFQIPGVSSEMAGATGAGLRHESWLDVWLNVVTANPDQPDTDLHELAADCLRWMMTDASDLLVNAVGQTGEVLYDGMKSHVQIADVAGKAAARLLFRVWYKWQHDAP